MDLRSEKLVRLVALYFWGFLSIGATIRTRRETQCLPYVGFLLFKSISFPWPMHEVVKSSQHTLHFVLINIKRGVEPVFLCNSELHTLIFMH